MQLIVNCYRINIILEVPEMRTFSDLCTRNTHNLTNLWSKIAKMYLGGLQPLYICNTRGYSPITFLLNIMMRSSPARSRIFFLQRWNKRLIYFLWEKGQDISQKDAIFFINSVFTKDSLHRHILEAGKFLLSMLLILSKWH